MDQQIIHKELSYKLNGIFYYIHNRLGRYCIHKQYADAMEIIFREKGVNYEREIEIPIEFSGELIKGNRIDFLVENLIPVDIKTENILQRPTLCKC